MGGLFGIGGSASKTDRSHQLGSWGSLMDVGSFGIGGGEKNLGLGTSYYQDILSGDPARLAQAIAPETNAIKGEAEQKKKTMAEFGGRSGGQTAAANQIDTNTQSQITNLINTLVPQAAQNLEQTGLAETGLGLSAEKELAGQTEAARKVDLAQGGAMGGALGSLLKVGLGFIPGIGGILSGLFPSGNKSSGPADFSDFFPSGGGEYTGGGY